MRYRNFLPAVLLTLTFMPNTVQAQVSPPASATPPTAKAKTATFITSQVLRQEDLFLQPPPASISPLTLAAPPGATVTLEVDARDADLLGMVKDLLSGMGEKGASGAGPISRFGPMGGMPIDTILKDVTHLRLIQYKKSIGAVQPENAVAGTTGADAMSFYEKRFSASGGRRLLYSGEGTRVLIMGFDTPRGMAFVTEDGTKVTVAHLEGKINMKPLSAMIFGMTGMGNESQTTIKKPAAKPTGSGAKTSKKATRG